MIPVKGLQVKYKNHVGYVRFVDDSYATVCICEQKEKIRDVCIVVYKHEFKNLQLLKESDK